MLSVSIGQEAGWASGRGASGKKKSSSSSRPARRVVTVLTHLTLRRLMSYIYGAPILDVSRSHTTTQHSR